MICTVLERKSSHTNPNAGADRVLAMDLHSGQCVGYFDIPVDHTHGDSVILDYLSSKRISTGDLVVVSPDVGGVARARSFAKKLNDAPLAIVDKRRSAHNVSEVMNLIGDVRGKVAVLVDDMIDTAGTITNAAKVLRNEGAREVYACATHAVFSPPAIERLSSGVFEEVRIVLHRFCVLMAMHTYNPSHHPGHCNQYHSGQARKPISGTDSAVGSQLAGGDHLASVQRTQRTEHAGFLGG